MAACLHRWQKASVSHKKNFEKLILCVILYAITIKVEIRKVFWRNDYMKHIKTLNTKNLQNTVKKGGCGECQTSCQSACKTSCTVGNQSCENTK